MRGLMQLSLLRLAALATVWGVPVAARAQFSWTTNDGSLTITAYTGPGGAVTIPASTNGLPVTGIGNSAFLYCTALTSITIPNGIINIGGWAFFDCSGLTSVALPDSVTSIGDYAFAYCAGLTNVALPNTVTNIGNNAFTYCNGLTGVTIPESVATIGDYAFAYCAGLANVAMPGGVTSIGDYAFAYCTGLASVVIPDGVVSIGSFAFEACSGLTNFAIPGSVTNVAANAFYLCTKLSAINVDARNAFYSSAGGVLFNQGRTTLICCPGGQAGTYTVPNSVTNIAAWAFGGCGSLAGVAIADGVTSLGDNAFYGCSNLASVTLPGGVSNIPPYAFARCGKLAGVTIPDSVTRIGEDAFYGCSSLASVTIPGSVTSIGSYAFASNSVLGLIYFLGNAPAADSSVFYEDYSFPSSSPPVVRHLWGTAGWHTVFAGLPTAFWDPVSQLQFTTSNGAITITGYAGSGGAVTIPPSLDGLPVTSIADSAFSHCGILTNLTIGNGVTSIGQSAFGGCTNLAGVTTGNGVTNIGDSAFSGCRGVTNVIMGNRVANIGPYAFESCSSLTNLTLPNTVSSIGRYAFGGCSSLASVTVPDRVTTIADYAFIACTSLTSVTLGNSVSSIGQSAFCACISLAGMTIPSSVTSLGDQAFFGSFNLTGVYFQGPAPSLGSGVFDNDNNATVYYLPCRSGWGSTLGGLPAAQLNWIAFNASPTYATYAQLPLTVNFTSPGADNCGEKIAGWHWSFGDGSTSTAQNPTHTYTTNGTFAPSLRATNSAGLPVVGAGPPITVSQPSVAFTANPTDGTVPLTVSFASAGVDNGGNAVTNWNWSFGDGSTSTAQTPSHTYASKGAFSPVLIAANDLGDAVTGSGPASIVALWGGSTVGFSAVPTDGTVPATVSFGSAAVDSSGNAVTNWNWSFGDGSTSTAQNPSHTYTTTGDFAPSLLATNNAGVLVVGVGPSVNVSWPSVAWTLNPTFGTVPLTVSFTSAGVDNRGNAVTNWNWSFGDGSTSTAQNPTHTYTTAGDFDPALAATNNLGVMIIAGLGSIEVLPAGNVGFTANPTNGAAPLLVSFTSGGLDSNGNAVTNWSWSFGDGSTSTAQNPSHLYILSGSFSIALIGTNNLGGTITGSGPASITATNAPPPPDLVTNGGFETGDFTGWTRSGADLGDDFVDDGSSSGISPHSGRYLGAFGSAGAPSYLSQTLSTVAGVFYSLSLWLDSPEDGQGTNELLVSWNGSTLFYETNIPAVGWTNLQFLASATGATTVLEFGIREDFTYLGLDDISVSPSPAPVGFANVGVQTNRFGFVITGTSNLVIVVEASTKLANPAWLPVQTNALTGGSFYFSDPGWTNYPSRFYRVRGP